MAVDATKSKIRIGDDGGPERGDRRSSAEVVDSNAERDAALRDAPPDDRKGRVKAFSAGVVPVFLRPTGEPVYLLLRCYNYWDFPKGGLIRSKNETPFEAALRELEEETTLTEVFFDWGYDFRETPIYASGKVARYYVARVERQDVSLPIVPSLGRAEHQEFRWVNHALAAKLVGPRVLAILDWAHKLVASPVSGPVLGPVSSPGSRLTADSVVQTGDPEQTPESERK